VRNGKRESLGEEECLYPGFILMTVFGSEFQTAGVEHRKVRFAKIVVVYG